MEASCVRVSRGGSGHVNSRWVHTRALRAGPNENVGIGNRDASLTRAYTALGLSTPTCAITGKSSRGLDAPPLKT